MTERFDLSIVIPVFNGATTIGNVVDDIRSNFGDLTFQIVLVDDGSRDGSTAICRRLAADFPASVTCVVLSRNFGEHNAVLEGLRHARGEFVLVLDDDLQNPPSEGRRLFEEIRRTGVDVVYGRYRAKQHSAWRNLGSAFNDRVANWMLGKPRGLYLSSFKVMNRFVVDQLVQFHGRRPYLDGLILRVTREIGQIDVEHRRGGASTYDFRKLVGLWLTMFVSFSILPLRAAAVLGFATSAVALFLIILTIVDKLYWNPAVTIGVPTILLTVVFFAGVQLVILGTIGEYLGRVFLEQSGEPQAVVRSIHGLGAVD